MLGRTISHYTIVEKLGAGGMGEVYRAQDTRLHRDVAVKVLPDAFAQNPDWLARFSREAQALASLNHPHIASIHGLEEIDGQRVLVMELVEGETLAERLQRGPLPLDEALGLARQIAEGLEDAHEHGIIHRDLKPANIKVTPSGAVKLLDFGLAKALEGDLIATAAPDLALSPTLSIRATQAGMILGTAAYMSPEQARGVRVDRRSDVWAFGVVLYEMLTGRQVFAGDTTSDVIASVLKSEPDLTALPKEVPPAIRALVRRCLVRDPRQRLQAIGDARIAIDEYLARPAGTRDDASAPAAAPVIPLWRRAVPWGHLAVTAAIAAALAVALSAPRSDELPLRLDVQVADTALYLGIGPSVALSPDGNLLAYVSGDDNTRALHVRSLDQTRSLQLVAGAGTGLAPYHPFFSPDGKWVGYVTAGELRKVPVTGGTPQTLSKVERSRGASWAPDDTIVISPSPEGPLFRVSAAGGQPQPLTTLDKSKKELTHRWPQVLPGGKAVIFTSHTKSTGDFGNATLEAVVLATGERKVLHRGGSYGRYLPTGHLVFVNQGTLFAVPFDVDRLEVKGSPAPAVQDVAWTLAHGGAQFSYSDTGRLVFVKGENTVPTYPIVWVDRNGRTAPLWDQRGSYANPRLSPDGKRLALTVYRDGNWDVWVYDLERGVPTRLTFDEASETEQQWSPDSEYLVFSSDANGPDNLYRKRADGSGEVERLTESTRSEWASSWSSDGKHLAVISAEKGFDLFTLPLTGDRKPQTYLSTTFSESSSAFSPDGRWIAYDSNESGRLEVYIRPFPPRGGKWQVSDGGGAYPRWSRDGRELFYRTNAGIMVAAVEALGETLRAGKPRQLLAGAFRGGTGGLGLAGNSFADYDVSRDGQRFVMFPSTEAIGQTEHPHVTLVTHWFDELRRTVEGAGK